MRRSKWNNRTANHPNMVIRAAYHVGVGITLRDKALDNARLETSNKARRCQWVALAREHSRTVVGWLRHLRALEGTP